MTDKIRIAFILSVVFGFFVGLATLSPVWGIVAFIFMLGFAGISFDLTEINESLKKIAGKN